MTELGATSGIAPHHLADADWVWIETLAEVLAERGRKR